MGRLLPECEVDLVYLYSDNYIDIDASKPATIETDFFTVTRNNTWGGVKAWFMCTPEAAEKLIAMDFENLEVEKSNLLG